MAGAKIEGRVPRSETRLPGLDEIEQRQPTETGIRAADPDDGDKGPTPEEALAEAQRVIAARDTENAELRGRLTAAETDADKSHRLAAESASARVVDQGAAIDGALVAATAKRDAATQRLKQARADNDVDEEAKAISDISEAGSEIANAKNTKQRFETWKADQAKKPPAQQRQQEQPKPGVTQDGPTPETRAWLGDHPRYYADPNYQADAMSLNDKALSLNLPEGSKVYVDYIDAGLEKLYGKNHGQIDRKGGTKVDNRETRRSRASTGAPPDRGDGNYSGGGDFEYRHSDGSSIKLVRGVGQDGKPYETVQGTIPPEWREFAKISRMSEVAYAVDQLKIRQDMEPGGDLEGLASRQNGVYRA